MNKITVLIDSKADRTLYCLMFFIFYLFCVSYKIFINLSLYIINAIKITSFVILIALLLSVFSSFFRKIISIKTVRFILDYFSNFYINILGIASIAFFVYVTVINLLYPKELERGIKIVLMSILIIVMMISYFSCYFYYRYKSFREMKKRNSLSSFHYLSSMVFTLVFVFSITNSLNYSSNIDKNIAYVFLLAFIYLVSYLILIIPLKKQYIDFIDKRIDTFDTLMTSNNQSVSKEIFREQINVIYEFFKFDPYQFLEWKFNIILIIVSALVLVFRLHF